jgi:hypothetical protein
MKKIDLTMADILLIRAAASPKSPIVKRRTLFSRRVTHRVTCNRGMYAEKRKGKVKHRRKINRTFAYWSTKCILIGMFIKKTIGLAFTVFDSQVVANTEIVRPGRREKR